MPIYPLLFIVLVNKGFWFFFDDALNCAIIIIWWERGPVLMMLISHPLLILKLGSPSISKIVIPE